MTDSNACDEIARVAERDAYTRAAVDALRHAVAAEHSFPEWLAAVLATVATHEEAGSYALIAGRPGSWEADLVERLVSGTVGWDDEFLSGYATAPGGPKDATRTYTHPDVLTIGVEQGWADPETDPTRIDWPARLAAAAIPFEVVGGRPVNPCEKTGVRYGRNELGHWGEALAADALVSATDSDGCRWIVMVERADGHGWALPGGHVDPGETATDAAVRELAEETGLALPDARWKTGEPQYVPDPRASDEAWMVTVLAELDLGVIGEDTYLPSVTGSDDAARAEWVLADDYDTLADDIAFYGGKVFPAHVDMLRAALDERAIGDGAGEGS